MAISLNSNIAVLQAQRRLDTSGSRLEKIFERLSSGQRINRASDDAAGLAISSALNAQKRVFAQGVRNLNDGISALSIADQSLGSLTDIVTRQRELAFQAANGTLTDTQRASLNLEAQELAAEYQRTIDTTTFNGLSLFDGSRAVIHLQAGFGEDSILSAQILEQGADTIEQSTIDESITNDDFENIAGDPDNIGFIVDDFDGDQYDDVLVVSRDALGGNGVRYSLSVFLGNADGSNYQRAGTIQSGTLDPVGSDVDSLAVQFNAGIVRVMAADGIARTTHEYTVNGDGSLSFSATNTNIAIDEQQAIGTGDFNDDGVQDSITQTLNYITFTTSQLETISGIQSLTQSSFSLATRDDALSAIDTLDSLSDVLSTARSTIGASQSRIDASLNVLRAREENVSAAESRILDADIATEASELVRNSILQNAAAAILAQARTQPEIALSLLTI